MCLGNFAEVSSEYINRQLQTHWENSQRCVQKHNREGLKPQSRELEYGFALSEFYYRKAGNYQCSKDDMTFWASFGCPRLEFVCNHEAILYLEVKEGHLYLDNDKGAHPDAKGKQPFNDKLVAFRLNYSTHTLRNVVCKAIGNANSYELTLLVLDTASASFCDYLSRDLAQNQDFTEEQIQECASLVRYLGPQYLGLLKRAGYHVLHALPDFDNLSRSRDVDYSVVSRGPLIINEIFGISIKEVDSYLQKLWLDATAYIDEHGVGESYNMATPFHLAEHRCRWNDESVDAYIHTVFGPLKVEPLCQSEVVLWLDVHDVHFFTGGFVGDALTYHDWKVALIVDVELEETEEGQVRRLKLDLSSARFCKRLSTVIEEVEVRELFYALVQYITTRYVRILDESKHHYVYHHDTRVVVSTIEEEDIDWYGGDEDEDLGCTCESETECTHTYVHGHIYWGKIYQKIISHSYEYDYDLVTSVTQGALNKYGSLLWETASQKLETPTVQDSRAAGTSSDVALAYYVLQHEGQTYFTASFSAPQIQLVCTPGSRKVIVYYHVKEGSIRNLGPNKKLDATSSLEHHFDRLTMAFEIGLKLRSCSDTYKVPEKFRKYLDTCNEGDYQQLVLDFSTAKYLDSKSYTSSLAKDYNFRLIRKRREALVEYFTRYYFPTLAQGGLDVLYTLPVSATSAFSITSIDFQVCPFTFGPDDEYVEGIRGRQRAMFERNMIIFVGMAEGRSFTRSIPHSGTWAFGLNREITQGTVILSREVFLKNKLSSLLSYINASTTVIPTFSGVEEGKLELTLKTWKDSAKAGRDCSFKQSSSSDGRLEFIWHNVDRWAYEHEGGVDNSCTYRVSCETTNKILVPTGFNDGSVAIQFTGKVVLKLALQGVSHQWQAEECADWSTALSFVSTGAGGLSIQASSAIVPEFSGFDTDIDDSGFLLCGGGLEAQLPTSIQIGDVATKLRGCLEGPWHLSPPGPGVLCASSPVLDHQGALLLELQSYTDVTSDVKRENPFAASKNGRLRKIIEVHHDTGSYISQSSPPPNYSPKRPSKYRPGYFPSDSDMSFSSADNEEDVETDVLTERSSFHRSLLRSLNGSVRLSY
ncbi:hypothetical protein EWM64_g3867 [Hericium alpestre]|uniref:Uncharacterized protein n=1 Tax=Hericium alpestre TaxID=135208 RepID=A0A4Z0A1D9_9AGAM|nr:hypothetical protein EWM64_g3867 [Hericium alpestre]